VFVRPARVKPRTRRCPNRDTNLSQDSPHSDTRRTHKGGGAGQKIPTSQHHCEFTLGQGSKRRARPPLSQVACVCKALDRLCAFTHTITVRAPHMAMHAPHTPCAYACASHAMHACASSSMGRMRCGRRGGKHLACGAHAHAHAHANVHVHMCMRTPTCQRAHANVHMPTCTCTCACQRARAHVHAHAHMHMATCTWQRAHANVHMRMPTCTCTCARPCAHAQVHVRNNMLGTCARCSRPCAHAQVHVRNNMHGTCARFARGHVHSTCA